MTPRSPHDELQSAVSWPAMPPSVLYATANSARSSSPNFHLWPPRKYDTTTGRVHNDDASPINARSVVAHWTPTLFVAWGSLAGWRAQLERLAGN